MELTAFLERMIRIHASEVFIVAGRALSWSLNKSIQWEGKQLKPGDTEELLRTIYTMADRDMEAFRRKRDDDFSFSIPNMGRFRVNAFMQRGTMAAVIRIVAFELPDAKQLGIPETVMNLHTMTKGLILVTGPAGSGKSTTLACLIDQMNRTREAHIITLEDPLEYLHRHKKSIVSQREVPMDTESYASGLRAALREAPSVILLGEMRDYETIATAMSAAETGLLVLSTLHTLGAANTVDRIIDVFPPNQQQQVRVQLSMVLQAVVSQQLIPAKDGSVAPAFEIMKVNGAIRNMIRESKVHQIDTVIYSSAGEGMISMDASILELYRQGKISAEEAMTCAAAPAALAKKMGI